MNEDREIDWQAKQLVIAKAVIDLHEALTAANTELQILLVSDSGLEPELAIVGEALNFCVSASTRMADLLRYRWDARREAREAHE